jgi:pimeloyl-ACP methyl ester carboxylesterase
MPTLLCMDSHFGTPITAWAVRARAGRPEIRSVLAGARCEHMLTESELGTVPVLLVWGEHERVFSEADLAWFTQHLNAQHTTVVRPAGCGHIPFLDRQELQYAINTNDSGA